MTFIHYIFTLLFSTQRQTSLIAYVWWSPISTFYMGFVAMISEMERVQLLWQWSCVYETLHFRAGPSKKPTDLLPTDLQQIQLKPTDLLSVWEGAPISIHHSLPPSSFHSLDWQRKMEQKCKESDGRRGWITTRKRTGNVWYATSSARRSWACPVYFGLDYTNPKLCLGLCLEHERYLCFVFAS